MRTENQKRAAEIDAENYYLTSTGKRSHFHVNELRCRCWKCDLTGIHVYLIDCLEQIRDLAGAAVHVNSGIRCEAHNRAVGGASNSMHVPTFQLKVLDAGGVPMVVGWAADFSIRGYSPKSAAILAARVVGMEGGIGIYESFTHVDVREYRAFWVG